VRELLERLRQGFLALMSKGLVGLPDDDLARVETQARRLGPAAIVRAMEVLGDALVAMREAPDPRVVLEVALVRLTRPEADTSTAALLERIERLERAMTTQGPAGPRPPASDAPHPPSSHPSSQTPSPAAGPRLALGGVRSAAPAAAPPPAEAASSQPAAPSADDDHASAPFPTRDELTLAWGDVVLARMSRRAAVRFQVGRFAAVERGTAVFALPNAVHRDRCEEVRAEAEQALAAHFGRPVPLRVVAESQLAALPATPTPEAPVEEDVAWQDLDDAPETLPSPVDHLMQAFEGAQVVEE
jgi:DNA polymerase-3 subunit gamma/tau